MAEAASSLSIVVGALCHARDQHLPCPAGLPGGGFGELLQMDMLVEHTP